MPQQGGQRKETENKQGSENRGFASMDEEKRREIARKGGRAAHEKGTAHEFTSEEAREAGQNGGSSGSGSRNQGQEEDNEGSRAEVSNEEDNEQDEESGSSLNRSSGQQGRGQRANQ